ncbi:LppX_LprAFG lipoprotein, partial [Nocardioides sp.]|uniref:LppX_LprAFG lipoprotein n=1 Tax=Nocardioides sp. TaxID=35761 RepID=UPI003567F276
LAACGGEDSPSEAGATPEEVMAAAKVTLDETSGVRVALITEDLPEGVIGATKAEGVATHPPAFDGTITVVLSGQAFDVPVIAVDGKVYAQIPLTPGWQDIDPGDYGAPDPAQLLSPDAGLSSVLTATTGLEEGDSVRGGTENREILTEYTGTVTDAAVKNILPGASGSFDATYTVTDGNELRSAELTGVFYPGTESMTYTISFDDYGIEQDITAP